MYCSQEESQFIRALGSDTEAGSMEAQSSRVIDDNFDFLDRLEQLEAQERSTASATAAAGAQSSSSGGLSCCAADVGCGVAAEHYGASRSGQ